MDIPPLTLSPLKVGDKVDAKDDWEKYYLPTILFTKQTHHEFPNNNEMQELSASPAIIIYIKYLYPNDWVNDIGLFIHYNGCSSLYDEWIFIIAMIYVIIKIYILFLLNLVIHPKIVLNIVLD